MRVMAVRARIVAAQMRTEFRLLGRLQIVVTTDASRLNIAADRERPTRLRTRRMTRRTIAAFERCVLIRHQQISIRR